MKTLHLFILCTLAFAQPLFNVLAGNSTFFVAHGSEPVDLFAMIVLLCVAIPAILALIEWIASAIHPKAAGSIHAFFIVILVALIALPFLNHLRASSTVIFLMAGVLGVALVAVYFRWKLFRMFLTFLSPALLVVPAFFLFQPQIRTLFAEESHAGFTAPKLKNKMPIVFLVLDEFPMTSLMDDQRMVDPVRFPNFARLARNSTWFRNASAVAMLTHSAVPGILTGKYPVATYSPTMRDYPYNLFTLLEDSYEMHVFETVTRLAPRSVAEVESETFMLRMKFLISDLSAIYLHIILPEDIAGRLPSVSDTWDDFWNQNKEGAPDDTINPRRDRTEFFARFLNSIKPSDKSELYFLHVMLPHRPWKYLPSGKEYADDIARTYGTIGDDGKVKWINDESVTIEGYQRHLLQLAFVDKLLGEVLDKLTKAKLYERSLIIVTADHGISFWPNEFLRIPTSSNFQDILLVPLFVKMPNQTESKLNDQNVETVDILPTIASILGIDPPKHFDGVSLFSSHRAPHKKRIVAGGRLREFPANAEDDPKTLNRKIALFGSRTPAEELFRIETNANLIGRSVSEVRFRPSNYSVQLWKPNLFRNVNLSSKFIPAFVAGQVSPQIVPETKLAIAINGSIRAVAQTFDSHSKFRAMVPEDSFRNGNNEVKILVIPDQKDQPLLLAKQR